MSRDVTATAVAIRPVVTRIPATATVVAIRPMATAAGVAAAMPAPRPHPQIVMAMDKVRRAATASPAGTDTNAAPAPADQGNSVPLSAPRSGLGAAQSEWRRAPCYANPLPWDLDQSGINDWVEAAQKCQSCPLLARCQQLLLRQYPHCDQAPARPDAWRRNPSGVVWAGLIFSAVGNVLTPIGVRRSAARIRAHHMSRRRAEGRTRVDGVEDYGDAS